MQLATGIANSFTNEWDGERRRVYLQALIDQAGWSVEAIDQFADELAADSWAGYHVPRRDAAALLRAFMAGWDAGYTDGMDAGYQSGLDDAGVGAAETTSTT